jgi:gluconolactonase
MMVYPPIIVAERFTRLPTEYHYTGEPNAWVRMTRPGQRLHSFLEGPCFDKSGALWVTDVPYGRVFRIGPTGRWELALAYDGEPHSIKLDKNGGFLIADYRKGLLRFDANAKTTSLIADGINSERFRGLSDLAVAPDGDLWITDSGRTSLSDPTGRVLRYRADGTLDLILANVPYPNGIAVSPNGSFVYVAATRANAVWRFLANAPDPVFPMVGTYIQLSGGLGPDGLAVADDGCLAVAHAQAGRAYVFDELGDPIAQVRVPEGLWVTSLAFGGVNQNLLYIVEAQTGSIYQADLSELRGSK